MTSQIRNQPIRKQPAQVGGLASNICNSYYNNTCYYTFLFRKVFREWARLILLSILNTNPFLELSIRPLFNVKGASSEPASEPVPIKGTFCATVAPVFMSQECPSTSLAEPTGRNTLHTQSQQGCAASLRLPSLGQCQLSCLRSTKRSCDTAPPSPLHRQQQTSSPKECSLPTECMTQTSLGLGTNRVDSTKS